MRQQKGTSPRWYHRSLLTLLPITRTTNYSCPTCRTPLRESWSTRVRLEHPLHHRDPDRRHLKGKRSGFTQTKWPLPQACAAPAKVSPKPMAPSMGKREPRVDIQLPQHCGLLHGSPHSGLAPQGRQGCLWDVSTRDLIVTAKWGRACSNQHPDLGRPSSYLRRPGRSPLPAVALLICRAKAVASSDQGIQWDTGLPVQALKQRAFPVLEPGLPPPRQGS